MRQHGTQATAEEFPAVVGILWNAPRAGETATVRTVGSSCWPFTPEGPARANLSLILQAARALGHQVPERFLCYAGQMIYHHGRLEDVRLLGGVLGEWDAEHRADITYWSTPVAPTITIGPDGEPCLDPEDADRTHLSASIVEGREIDGWPAMAFLWDLQANLPARRLPATEADPPLLPRLEEGHLFDLSPAHYHAL